MKHLTEKIAIALLILHVATACSVQKQVDQDPMLRLAQADISLTVINPDTLTDYEVDFKNDKPVSTHIVKWARPEVLGFIGDFDRFRIKFTKVERTVGTLYSVHGIWSWYGDEGFVKDFKGSIRLDSVMLLPPIWDFGKDYNDFIHRTEGGMIYATVELNDNQGNSWKGHATYEYDVIDGQYHYATLDESDGYSNNAYEGVMTSKDGERVCNWGDFRIPGSGNHDTGCGMFSPQGGRGWENYNMIADDTILCQRDRDWMNVRWQELDWDYERVLETCYLKLVKKQVLTHDEYLALMPQSRTQFWQFWQRTAHLDEEGFGRDFYLDEAVTGEMEEGNFDVMEKFLPACWQWADGGVAEEMVEVDYQLWKKYPRQVEAIANKNGYLKALKGEIETVEEYYNSLE